MAAPIGAIDQLTVVSTDGAGAMPKQVTDNVVQTLNMLKTSTGLDLEQLIQRSVQKASSGMGLTSGEVAAGSAAGGSASSDGAPAR